MKWGEKFLIGDFMKNVWTGQAITPSFQQERVTTLSIKSPIISVVSGLT
jgi:hypothetical protein